MHVLRDISEKLRIAGELIAFLWQRKLWWMIPIVLVLLLFGILTVTGSTTGAGPFVYTLF